MKRKSATKQALFSSVLALLLCVSMLVSSTFAWFTDEVKTGMNTIAAGNLDIALLANGTEVQSGDVLFSKDVNGDDIKLWEPGMVVYENLQIVNKGSLELKYQLFLNFGSENAMKDGGYKLSDVLQVALIDKVAAGTSREAVLAAAEASAKKGALSDFYITGELAADTAATEQAVVIFWKPNSAEIDNLYNDNNGKETTDGNPLHIEVSNLSTADDDAEMDALRVVPSQTLNE